MAAVPAGAFAQKSELHQAMKAYNDSDYVKSVELYQQIGRKYGYDSALLYDLGNAYARLDNYGAAVLNYRKALKFDPSNSSARHNLAYVEQKVAIANESRVADKNADPTPAPLPFFSRLRILAERPGSDFYAWGAAAMFMLACLGAAFYLFASSPKLKKIGFFSALPAVGLCAVALVLSFSARSSAFKADECVILAPEVILRSDASAEGKEMGVPLTGGTTVRLLENRKGKDGAEWVKVYLNDEFTGWLPSETVETVRI